MPATLNLTIRTGDTETVSVAIKDSTGAAVDITGRTYAAQIREQAESTSALANFSCTITSAVAGTLAATLSATTTATLTPGLAVWDLQETNGSVVTTLLAGQVTIIQDVTRA